MKVSELREILRAVPGDSEVFFLMDSGCCGDQEALVTYDSDTVLAECGSSVSLFFKALPGYRSCIQVSQTVKADLEYWAQFGKKPEDFK